METHKFSTPSLEGSYLYTFMTIETSRALSVPVPPGDDASPPHRVAEPNSQLAQLINEGTLTPERLLEVVEPILNRLMEKSHPGDKPELFSPSVLNTEELQELVDDVFAALVSIKVGSVIASEVLARIWMSTHSIPTQLLLHGVTGVSPHPFAMTASSNISEGMVNSTPVALKAFRRTQTQPPTEEDIARLFFEALVSSTTRHANILLILGMHIGPSRDIYLVSTLMKHGSLPDYLAANPTVDRLFILTKVADAVAHLHSLPIPILHGDIRGPNIVVADNGEPLVIDFGCSAVMDLATSEFSPASHAFVGNPRWTPRERMRPTEFPLTLKADCFSFASLMLEVLSGDMPYCNLANDGAVIVEVLVRKRIPARPHAPQLTDFLWSLMKQCWALNPADRPSMDEIRRSLAAEMAVRTELS